MYEDEETPGMAGERTDLAWSRSGLAVLASLAALAKRLLNELDVITASGVIVAALFVGAGAWITGLLWARTIAETTLAGRTVSEARTLRLVAWGTVAIGVAALAIAFLPD